MTAHTITQIQQRLIELGYDVGPDGADGDFGVNTQRALRKYQAENDLTVTGQPDAATRVSLFPTAPVERHTTMNWLGFLNNSVVLGFVRNLLMAAGAVLVTKGWVDNSTLIEVVGWVMSGISAILSAISNNNKAKADAIVKAVEAHPDITVIAPPTAAPNAAPKVIVSKP